MSVCDKEATGEGQIEDTSLKLTKTDDTPSKLKLIISTGRIAMEALVKVELIDGKTCQVAHKALDLLLEHNEVSRFKRSNGWAVIGRDPLRNMNKGLVYSVPERRSCQMNSL